MKGIHEKLLRIKQSFETYQSNQPSSSPTSIYSGISSQGFQLEKAFSELGPFDLTSPQHEKGLHKQIETLVHSNKRLAMQNQEQRDKCRLKIQQYESLLRSFMQEVMLKLKEVIEELEQLSGEGFAKPPYTTTDALEFFRYLLTQKSSAQSLYFWSGLQFDCAIQEWLREQPDRKYETQDFVATRHSFRDGFWANDLSQLSSQIELLNQKLKAKQKQLEIQEKSENCLKDQIQNLHKQIGMFSNERKKEKSQIQQLQVQIQQYSQMVTMLQNEQKQDQ